eukprot:scaffold17826_cov72-Cyclotella_meneghiniana.AAC.1
MSIVVLALVDVCGFVSGPCLGGWERRSDGELPGARTKKKDLHFMNDLTKQTNISTMMADNDSFSLGLQRAPSQASKSQRSQPVRSKASRSSVDLDSDRDTNSSSDRRSNEQQHRKPHPHRRNASEEWLSTQRLEFDLDRPTTKLSKPLRPYPKHDEFDFCSSSDESRGHNKKPKSNINRVRSENSKWQRITKNARAKNEQAVVVGYQRSSSEESSSGDDMTAKQSKPACGAFAKKTKPNSNTIIGDTRRRKEAQAKHNYKVMDVKKQSKIKRFESSSSSSSCDESSPLEVQTKPNSNLERKKQTQVGYESSSSNQSSPEEVQITRVKQTKHPTNGRRSKLKSRKSNDSRQMHSDRKVAKSRADNAKLPKHITSPSQLRWHRIRIKKKKIWELNVRPCRILGMGEAARAKKRHNLDSKSGNAVIQFLTYPDLTDGEYDLVDDTTLFPFCEADAGVLDQKSLDEYVKQQKGKIRKSVQVEAEKLFLMRVFENAKRIEAESNDVRAPKDLKYDDEYSSSEKPQHTYDEENTKSLAIDASDDDELETPRPLFEEEEEKSAINEDFLDCPYTQAMNFDPDSNNLDEDVSNEPMRPGDVIEYYSPIFVVGDKRGLRQATILGISPEANIILDLSTGDCLPEDTRVKRIKVVEGDQLFDHPGIYRPIESFKLIAGKVKGGSGIMREASRFGDIFRSNLSKMQAKAEADGFAPMDMFRMLPGGRKVEDNANNTAPKRRSPVQRAQISSPPMSPSSSQDYSKDESPKSATKKFKNHLDHRRIAQKQSPPSLKRAMNCSDRNNRRTQQTLQHSSSSSSSSSSDGETLNEVARQKYSSKKQTDTSTQINLGKENTTNSCKEKKPNIEPAQSPISLGATLASSSPSLGPSLDSSSSSSDESAQASPSKLRKISVKSPSPTKMTANAADASVDLTSERSSDESIQDLRENATTSLTKRNPLSQDDIEDSDDDIDQSTAGWFKGRIGWEKRSDLIFTRKK